MRAGSLLQRTQLRKFYPAMAWRENNSGDFPSAQTILLTLVSHSYTVLVFTAPLKLGQK